MESQSGGKSGHGPENKFCLSGNMEGKSPAMGARVCESILI
jgi:hypothetical protein